MEDWIKAIPGAVYDQAVEVIARYPKGAFWVIAVPYGYFILRGAFSVVKWAVL
jgi:hypothetical protein